MSHKRDHKKKPCVNFGCDNPCLRPRCDVPFIVPPQQQIHQLRFKFPNCDSEDSRSYRHCKPADMTFLCEDGEYKHCPDMERTCTRGDCCDKKKSSSSCSDDNSESSFDCKDDKHGKIIITKGDKHNGNKIRA